VVDRAAGDAGCCIDFYGVPEFNMARTFGELDYM
jgi:hypothetical protein